MYWFLYNLIHVIKYRNSIKLFLREKQKSAKCSSLTQLWVTFPWNLKPRCKIAWRVVFSKFTSAPADTEIPPDSTGTLTISLDKESNWMFFGDSSSSYCFAVELATLQSTLVGWTHSKWMLGWTEPFGCLLTRLDLIRPALKNLLSAIT